MKLAQFVEELEKRSHACPVFVGELGTSRKGNRKLEIQQFTYEPSTVGDNIEYESWFYLVVDFEENILFWEQTA